MVNNDPTRDAFSVPATPPKEPATQEIFGVQWEISPDKAVFIVDAPENSDIPKIKIFLPPSHGQELINDKKKLKQYVNDSINVYQYFKGFYPGKEIILKESNDQLVVLIPKKGFVNAIERIFSNLFGRVADKGYKERRMPDPAINS